MMSGALNGVTSEVNNAMFPKGLMKAFPGNWFTMMTVTGAKGGLVKFLCFLFTFISFHLLLYAELPLVQLSTNLCSRLACCFNASSFVCQ